MNYSKIHRSILLFMIFSCLLLTGLTGCSGQEAETEEEQDLQAAEEEDSDENATGFMGESAKDADVDFAALKEANPDIFGWIYIPGTEIDCPILQSMHGDDFYENHNAAGEEDPNGAVYIELANLNSMCDFNTVLHGSIGEDDSGTFADLGNFRNPDFFAEHDTVYIYLEDNVLTYIIFAAYERENTSLLRSYDFTYLSGCQEFLDDLYGIRDLRMNLRDGWEGVNPYNFLITLTTQSEDDADQQFVVIAILTQDAAGTINRIIEE